MNKAKQVEKFYTCINKKELAKSEQIASEIKEVVKYHLYDDGLSLI